MDESKLMLGDILMAVYYDEDKHETIKFPVKVTGLSESGCFGDDGEACIEWMPLCEKDMDNEFCDRLESIEFTEELLEYNKFERNASAYEKHRYGYFMRYSPCSHKFNLHVLKDGKITNKVRVKIRSLHEAQHILKQCGLHDVAKKFKLN